jgi:peptidyl-tRNA hydrolase
MSDATVRGRKPVLWILMRDDLASLNAGKAVAQGAHAANLAVAEAKRRAYGLGDTAALELLDAWEAEGGGFGTTIVLSIGSHEDLIATVEFAAHELHLMAGITHDPTYPLRDGRVTHLIPLDTCGWVFAHRDEIEDTLDGLSLMP